MQAEIIRKETWNNSEYCYILYSDGSKITLSGAIGQYTDEQWIALALEYAEPDPEPEDPMIAVLQCCSDQMLIDEVVRRHLVIAVAGEA